MSASDVHVVEFLEKDNRLNYTLSDSWSKTKGRPKPDLDLGGKNDIENIEYKIIDDKPVITYTRLFKTGDQYDKDIEMVFFSNLEK